MTEETVITNSKAVINDLLWLIDECDKRCLYECSRWALELICYMQESYYDCVEVTVPPQNSTPSVSFKHENLINFAKSLIHNQEYQRAKFFLEKVERITPVEIFLYYFSWYMISVRSRLENDSKDCEDAEEYIDTTLSELRQDMETFKKTAEEFDCFLNYLYGIIMKDSCASDIARELFYKAIHQDHRCWPAWDQLAKLSDIFYSVKMEKEEFGNYWQCQLYVAETLFRLQLFLSSIETYTKVAQVIGPAPYLLCQIATAQSDLQEHDYSISSFQHVRRLDPYRIEQMNYYSDSLYIRQNLVELSNIAKCFYKSHKFNWETCCIVANYYSARGNAEGHEMASNFLKRAARICSSNTSIWVLLGHELMETKRHQSAVAAYRKATVIDPLCYRAWYGLGQLYEILKLPAVALFYYQQAHKCKPADSRMLIALGVIFSRLKRNSDAEKCFKKAFQIGDVEGNALTNLARLYESQKDNATAAKAYEAYLSLYNEELIGDVEQLAAANQFLAQHYLGLNDYNKAYNYAQKCLNYNISKEEGFRILRLIMNQRSFALLKSSLTPSTSADVSKKPIPISSAVNNLYNQTIEETTAVETTSERTTAPEDDEIVDISQTLNDEENDEDDDMMTSDDDEIEISF